jgi:Cu/Zn superoxide dismutase
VKCGANLGAPAAPAAVQAAASAPAPAPVANYTPAPAAAAPKKGMSTLAKVAIAFLVVFVVVGVAGVVGAIYVVHRVKQKVNDVTGGLLADSGSHATTSSGSSSGASEFGDVCRFLSKDDVSRALGVSVVATKMEGDSCQYLVHGDMADLTAKHVAALGGAHGADAQQQNMVKQFAGGIFKPQSTDGHEATSDASGNAPVLVVGLQDNGITQMRLEKSTLGRFPGSEQLSGIGDEAFASGETFLTVRKGNRLVRFSFSTCPCTTKEIVPLAKKVAGEL